MFLMSLILLSDKTLYFKAKEGRKKVVRKFEDLAEIFKLYHDSPVGGHSGWNATYKKISRVYTWKAMVEDIQKLTATCSQCQRYSRIKTVAPEMKPIKVKEPLELIGVDMIADDVSTTTQAKGSSGELVLECESESLSEAQLNNIQKLKDELVRLQKLIQTNANAVQTVQKQNEITVPVLVNGTSTPAVGAPLTNGPSMVGLQVPQFLLLQNGQMIAASSTLQPASISTTSPSLVPSSGNSFPIATSQSNMNSLTFKPSTTTRVSSVTQAASRSQRIIGSSGKSSSSSSSSSSSNSPTVINNNNDNSDIQVLSEIRPMSQASAPSRSLRDVRISGASVAPSTSTSSSIATTFRPNASINSMGDIDMINGVTAVSSSTSEAARTSTTNIVSNTANVSTTRTAAGTSATTTATSSPASNTCNKYPLLNIVARPRNTLPPAVAMNQRKELDTKVKLVLVKSPQEFVEWLLSEGLIRNAQNCTIHKVAATQQPVKLKLGMFSDPKVLATSGGYVWISECCGKKYISVYSGSIFGSTPIDKVPPTSVLKLIYHWGCQTSITNVENWVKVDKSFINKMFQYLRCVCSVMLQDKVYDFGFDGTTVELGIVSLGTSTADGTKKAVKVEILGLYDRKMKSYRLFASEPEPGSSSRQRFVRILKPLERVVHTNALILCDQSVDRNCLYNMFFTRVSVCETNDNEDSLQYNARIMSYLRKHVPKMFQSALSQLNLQQVQLVLDELCWRERYGHCAAQAYSNMLDHIIYLTAREAENPGVLHLLDFVAQSPHHNWRYKSQHVPKGPTSLQPSIIMNTLNNSGPINPQVTLDQSAVTQTPLDHSNKVLLTARRVQIEPPPSQPSNNAAVSPPASKADTTELEPFYYGQIQGDPMLGREINTAKFVCHICSMVCGNNIDFYTHLKLHLSRSGTYGDNKVCCDYCAEHFTSEEKRIFHQRVKHMHLDARLLWCRICSEGFINEYNLVNHMAKKHFESELPYRCEVCNFVTSILYSLIDHFNTEHKNTAYVQCHFCLCVKSISPNTSSSFSNRIYQHLQRHMHQHTACKYCQLIFYSTYLRDEHRKKDHISRAGFPGLQRYKIPAGQKSRIMFRPWIRKQSSPVNAANSLVVPMALSTTLAWQDLKFNVPDLRDYNCIECQGRFSISSHFKSYMKCTRCVYSTCCRFMISKHADTFHPQGRNKKNKYKFSDPIVLPKPLFCICGFSSRSGNHMARHLVRCEGGRKSAYPSVSDALVYRGDVTGGMLNLVGTLGLENIGLANILPDVPMNNSSIDMAHFMSVSMDVDDS
ncbi:uncharacterized protein LOC123500056 isoform X3 [Portunus trituberculatus]|uniref:uncharacterized protein LOC123500056 isoform X3 n=1 Tax=Portunus trituberculatus TaxID=210409 RepID=UPI001E1CB4A3|nr:uncharacterized protein LOC123500056 isoform X3 [Portunus trituberculatus]